MQFPLGDGRGLGIGSQSLQQFYYFAQSQGWWSPLFSNLSVDPTSGRGLGIGPNLIDQNSVSFTIVIKLKYMPMRAQVFTVFILDTFPF